MYIWCLLLSSWDEFNSVLLKENSIIWYGWSASSWLLIFQTQTLMLSNISSFNLAPRFYTTTAPSWALNNVAVHPAHTYSARRCLAKIHACLYNTIAGLITVSLRTDKQLVLLGNELVAWFLSYKLYGTITSLTFWSQFPVSVL